MSKPELINSALEDENNGTEEIETSEDEHLSDFTKLQVYMLGTLCFKRVLERKLPRKRIIRFIKRC